MKVRFFFLTTIFSFFLYSQESKRLIYNSNINYNQHFIDSLIINKVPLSASEFSKILASDTSLKGWMKYYQIMASVVGREYKFDSVLYYSDKALQKFQIEKSKQSAYEFLLIDIYNVKAYALAQGSKDYNNAIKFYQKAFDLTKKHPFKWKSYLLSGIANAHMNLGNDSLAIKYYLKATKDSLYMTIPNASVSTLSWIGNLYKKKRYKDSALYYYSKAIEVSNKNSYYYNLASTYGMIGSIYYDESDINNAKKNYLKAIDANDKNGLGKFHGAYEDDLFFNGFIDAYDKKKHQRSIDSLEKVISIINTYDKWSKPDKELYSHAYKTISFAYKKRGQLEQYQEQTNKFINFLNSFQEKQLNEDLQNLETKYQTKEKDASILQLEENKQQQETIIKQQKTITFGLGGLLLLLLLSGILLWRQRKFKNQYEKENLEQRLLRSQMNPHFIGNAMNTVSALVDKKSEKTIPYINKLSNLFRLVLINSREEFVSLEDELTALNSYLELQSNFSNDFDFSVSLEDTIDIEEYIIPPMLIQPFVENAILHGIKPSDKRGILHIEISKNDRGLILCEIDDNGVGYSKEKFTKNRKSVSSDIIKERLEIFKKKFKVDSRFLIIDKKLGTKVQLYLPYLLDE